MATYRSHLPQLDGDRIFLSDGGLETSLIYQGGFDLPYFAAFHLMKAIRPATKPSATTTAPTPRSRSRTALASSSNCRPGAPIPTGRRSSVIPRMTLAKVNQETPSAMMAEPPARDLRDPTSTRRPDQRRQLGPRAATATSPTLLYERLEEAERYHAASGPDVFRDAGAETASPPSP